MAERAKGTDFHPVLPVLVAINGDDFQGLPLLQRVNAKVGATTISRISDRPVIVLWSEELEHKTERRNYG